MGKEIVYFYLGNIYNFNHIYEKAIKYYNKSLKIAPDRVYSLNNRGIALEYLTEYTDAISSYDKVLAIDSNNIFALNNRGITFGKLGRYEDAISSFNDALKIDPNFDMARHNLNYALFQLELGKYKKTNFSVANLENFKSKKDFAYYLDATLYAMKGDPDIALKNLKRAIRLNPLLKKDADNNIAFIFIKEDERFIKLIYKKQDSSRLQSIGKQMQSIFQHNLFFFRLSPYI